jgi:ABC-type transporter Mla subunit MlaD
MFDKLLAMAGINPQNFMAEVEAAKRDVGKVVAHFNARLADMDAKLDALADRQERIAAALERAAAAADAAVSERVDGQLELIGSEHDA